MLNLLNEAVLGLGEELGQSRNNNQQLHEKQMRTEQRMGEERNRANGEIMKNIRSVQTQEGRRQGGSRYEQANVPQNPNIGLKSEVKVEVPPPGLTYGGVGRRYFNQAPKDLPRRQSH